jgi:hypothetical protein
VVKGDAATDEGAYKLTLRDITHVPHNRVTCNDGTGNASSITQSLAAGTYYVAVKGNDPTSSGAYTLSVRDDINSPATSPYCNDNGSTYNTSKITTTLNAGTYYVALKGKTDTAEGKYQLSVGGGSTSSGSYVPPTWSQTLAAVQSTGVHVMPILSCHDDPDYGDADGDCVETRSQATTLANASNALGPNLEPLVFDIDGDGTGLSDTVVSGIADLAQYLEMDVKVRVLFDPDANPGFGVSVVAIDEAGDGCSGLIGIEHQNCLPGATPRFQIAFTNPLSNPVLPNPNDPMGGYSFRAELIGDDQFIVDQVPIYIIPLDVDGDEGPPEPDYYEMGSYEQVTGAGGCRGNDQPDWRDLSWVADVPENTAITFKACTAATVAGLATCVPKTIATVTGEGSCMTSADCAFGYCDQDLGTCQLARSGPCADSSACTYNAVCDTSVGLCTADRLPIYVGRALGEDNFDPYLRMVIELSGQEPFDEPPVLYSWELTYECNSML